MFTVLRRLTIAMAGVLVGHQIAHGLTPVHPHDSSHGYVGVALAVVVPLAVGSLWMLTRDSIRTGVDHIRPADLLAAQVVLFLGQEGIERMAGGGDLAALAVDSTLWSGIIAQAIVCGSLVLVMRMARRWFVPWFRSDTVVRLVHHFAAGIHRPALLPRPLPLRSVVAGRAPPFRMSTHPH